MPAIMPPLDAVARQQLAALDVARPVLLGPTLRRLGDVGAQFRRQRAIVIGARAELFAVDRDFGLDTRRAHAILPGTGRWQREALTEGPNSRSSAPPPASLVPLPVPGRN
jgi:hypothetical protein